MRGARCSFPFFLCCFADAVSVCLSDCLALYGGLAVARSVCLVEGKHWCWRRRWQKRWRADEGQSALSIVCLPVFYCLPVGLLQRKRVETRRDVHHVDDVR
ncbi:uncharacterized protein J3D65DRAFT_608271 [Phyllosticta citribraziliensis]|uniref:Secreted protein n=1 Tax=Phyllosticta citribraziliensis TaxID=989973 RepID=A0ABR1M819_9PEZI